jgi:endoglucanase
MNDRIFKCSASSIALLTVLSVMIFDVAAAASGATRPSVVDLHGALGVKGNRVVDKDGNPVVLHGMSLFWSQWMPQFYNAQAIKWLRDDWHCTVIRVPMGVEAGGYLTHPGVELQKIKTVIQAAIDLGIYVIIDWHDDHSNLHVEQSKAFFDDIAKTYGQYPNIIFEPWNEPGRTADWTTTIKPYHEAIIPVIRAHTNNLIICGTQAWSQQVDKASQNPLRFPNVAYTLHFYAGTHRQSLRDKATIALSNGCALFVTEWGDCAASGNGKLDAVETQKWLDFMDRNELSWCNWSVADKAETSAALRPGAAGTGGWTLDMLSPSGQLVRAELIKRNP